ncbi:hypothetical protein ACJMK2_008437 [Sinanodonta woodiana]|uniref:Multifunctional fusion protein n=1 Tax=Sinanodonta woodiana TaxID=1069815 RepID=A0ABD3VN69_SINWO
MLLTRTVYFLTNKCCISPLRGFATQTYNVQTFKAKNEPVLAYAPRSVERNRLEETLEKYKGQTADIPLVIGSEEIRTSDIQYQLCPFDHCWKVAKFYYADKHLIQTAIDNCLGVRKEWEMRPLEDRSQIFLRAADLMANKYRMDLLATAMIGQGKNIVQAEIDAACELVDFLRFNVQFARDITSYHPISPSESEKNQLVYRGMEGFWAAISPFNFTAIGGNLCTAPALMGNVSIWKPSNTAVLSNYLVFRILREAGLPPGVINFIPADGPVFGDVITNSPDLAGINFTGSVKTFRNLYREVGEKVHIYKSYPRLIGECGGKNMHFVHPSADAESVAVGSIKSAFEYNGQKCSALSRMYVPESLWSDIKQRMLNIVGEMKIGSALDGNTYVTGVIDKAAFDRIKAYIVHAKTSPHLKIITGGICDDSKGYFIHPTILQTTDPEEKIMQEEIFGPVVTVYVYPDDKWKDTAEKASTTSPFALTASIFSQDEQDMEELRNVFRDAAGNLYLNDKSTGSVVGQQPFGGARLSGTNDKAGGPFYLMKFVSPQCVKRTRKAITEWRYPHMASK